MIADLDRVDAPLALCVPADLIGVPPLFASNEAARFYLQGVFLEQLAERSGVVGTCTDGHTLGSVYAEDGHVAADIILHVKDAAFLRLCRKHGRSSAVELHAWVCAWPGTIKPKDELKAGSIELLLVASGTEKPDHDTLKALSKYAPDPKLTTGVGIIARSFAEPIDATFPSWRRVVPNRALCDAGKPLTCDTGAFQPAYVSRFADVAAIYKSCPRIVPASDCQSPHFVDVGFRDFVGVIMPIRGVGSEEPYMPPGWVRIPPASMTITEEEDIAA